MMKKLFLPLILLSGAASAASMECMVDTAAYDEWQVGYCSAMEFTFDNNTNLALWRITGVTKTVSQVLWSDATSGCAASALSCNKQIRPYHEHLGKATILYSDGTWEQVQATAHFETGF